MAEVFVINAVLYSLRGSTNLVLPKPGQICMALILSGFLFKDYGRLYRKKSKSPKHWRFSKEILRLYLLIAAVNYAKVLLYIYDFISILLSPFSIAGLNYLSAITFANFKQYISVPFVDLSMSSLRIYANSCLSFLKICDSLYR